MRFKSVVFYNCFLVAIIVNVLSVFVIFLIKKYLPPILPIFYGKPFGEEQLVPTLGLLIVPGVSLFITFVNLVLNMATKDLFLKKILAVAAIFVAAMGAITLIKIISLVGFF